MILGLLLAVGLRATLEAQGSAGTEGTLEPRYLVDLPTAGMLSKGSFALDLDFYQQGGVLLGLSVGLLDKLSFGVSYGGTDLIGSGEPVMNSVPGVNIKIRIIEENVALPAIVLGFDTQGRDGYMKALSRYAIKSPGIYTSASKNYSLLGFFSIHGGANYTFERGDDDKDINFFAGVEKSVGSVVSLLMEYNLASDDSNGKAFGKGRGYLNAGVKWTVGGGLTLAVCLKDLAKNSGNNITVANRTVKIEYAKMF
ncbi:MAG: hypothetical protein HW407_384 [Bacteroidetes bacterium]|nr:hypothetical protein [Bacteroidota bacterium]